MNKILNQKFIRTCLFSSFRFNLKQDQGRTLKIRLICFIVSCNPVYGFHAARMRAGSVILPATAEAATVAGLPR